MKGWRTEKLGNIVSIVGGGTPTRNNPAFYGGQIPWVTPKDMKSWEIRGSQVTITQSGLDNSTARLVAPNSVLIVVRSGVLKHTIPVAVNRLSVAINQDMKALQCITGVDPNFLARFIKAQSHIILRWVRATTADNFPIDKLKNLLIPFPPLVDQRRIAEVLDRADALRAKRRATLAKLDTLTQSIFIDLFGDPIVNPKGWPLKKFRDIGSLDRGVSKHRPRNAPELLGGAHPLIQTGEIANCGGYIRYYHATYSDLGLRQSKLWPTGTLCITIAANIAKTGILTFAACFPDSIVGFNAKAPETVEFVRIWLSFLQQSLEENAPESAQKNINLATLRNLDIPFPPPKLQAEFARRIVAVEKLKSAHRASQTKLDSLFTSLQHRAFRGEL